MTKNFVEIDEETGTEFWGRAINKEMSKVKVARKIHEGHTPEAV
jgi:ribosomal protein L31E